MVGLAPCTDNSVLDQGYLIYITNLLEKISRLLGGLISFFSWLIIDKFIKY